MVTEVACTEAELEKLPYPVRTTQDFRSTDFVQYSLCRCAGHSECRRMCFVATENRVREEYGSTAQAITAQCPTIHKKCLAPTHPHLAPTHPHRTWQTVLWEF